MGNFIRNMRKMIGPRKMIHPAARIVIENELGEILLIRRRDTEQWGLIAGALEENEDIRACIIREVKEETGLQILDVVGVGISSNPEKELSVYPNGDVVQYFTVVFYSNQWTGQLLQATEETKEALFFPKNKLPPLAPNEAPSLKWVEVFKKSGQFIIE